MSKQWPDKIIVGLTGNIATGKSTVMRMAAEKGGLPLDADKIVHEILEHDASMQAAIAVAFGSDVRQADGAIDRPALAAIVFNDDEALRDLEMMLHPAVRNVIEERVSAAEEEVIILEAIKLLEGTLTELIDQVWVTRAPRKVQIQRLMVCRGLDDETAALRVNAQGPQEAKVARADVVIDTDGTMAETRAQFELAWSRLSTPNVATSSPATQIPQRQEQATPARPQQEATIDEPPEPAETRLELPDDDKVIVRRARPSDIPGILLLIGRATGGEVQMKRKELLHAFTERSYLIGQMEAEMSTVIGWNTDSTTAVCMDQFYIYPPQAAAITGRAVLAEVEKSARQLICEVALAFLPPEGNTAVRQLLRGAGYRPMKKDGMPRAWQQTVTDFQPEGTMIVGKVLRDIRIA